VVFKREAKAGCKSATVFFAAVSVFKLLLTSLKFELQKGQKKGVLKNTP